DRVLPARGRAHQLRARVLRPGHDPAPAWARPRSPITRRPALAAADPSGDARAGAAAPAGRTLSPAWTPVALSRGLLQTPRAATERAHTPAGTAARTRAHTEETRVHRGEGARGETDDQTDCDRLL